MSLETVVQKIIRTASLEDADNHVQRNLYSRYSDFPDNPCSILLLIMEDDGDDKFHTSMEDVTKTVIQDAIEDDEYGYEVLPLKDPSVFNAFISGVFENQVDKKLQNTWMCINIFRKMSVSSKPIIGDFNTLLASDKYKKSIPNDQYNRIYLYEKYKKDYKSDPSALLMYTKNSDTYLKLRELITTQAASVKQLGVDDLSLDDKTEGTGKQAYLRDVSGLAFGQPETLENSALYFLLLTKKDALVMPAQLTIKQKNIELKTDDGTLISFRLSSNIIEMLSENAKSVDTQIQQDQEEEKTAAEKFKNLLEKTLKKYDNIAIDIKDNIVITGLHYNDTHVIVSITGKKASNTAKSVSTVLQKTFNLYRYGSSNLKKMNPDERSKAIMYTRESRRTEEGFNYYLYFSPENMDKIFHHLKHDAP